MPRTRSKSPPDCGFAGSLEAHRLFAGPEGRRQSRRGAALRKRKHRRTISRRPGLQRDITHYKKKGSGLNPLIVDQVLSEYRPFSK